MRKRIFFLLSLSLVFTLAIAMPSWTWGFDLKECTGTASTLLASCIEKSTSYGWTAPSQKEDFKYGCQYTGRTIFGQCKTESSCPAFSSYLNSPDSLCGSIQSQAKKDGCYEMFRQWKEAKLPFCPKLGLF